MNGPDSAPGAPDEEAPPPWLPVRETVPVDRRVSFLVHSDVPASEAAVRRALEALRNAGFGRDVHFLLHGALAPVEALTVATGARVFSSGPRLGDAALRSLARTFGYFPWCCVLPLRHADRETLEVLASAGPAGWKGPAGAFAFNRLLEWREPSIRPEQTSETQEDPVPVPAPGPAERPAISVIIPTYNRIDILERTLRGYAEQSLRKDLFEVIVVDDGSTDATWETLARLQGGMPYALRPFRQANKGPGQARNLALAESRGGIVFITGDDILPGPDILWCHYRDHKEHPGTEVAVLGKVDWAKDLTVNTLMHYITERSSLQFGFCELDAGKQPDFRYFYTSNISLKKAFLDGKAWFMPEFVHAAYEDIELGYRLSKQGMRVVYDREAIGFHYHPMTVQSFAKRQYKSGLMAPIFARMHPEMGEEIGFTATRNGNVDRAGLRADLDRLEGILPKLPCAQYADRPWNEVPEKQSADLIEIIRNMVGAAYTLGILDAIAEAGDAWADPPVPEAPVPRRDRERAAALNTEGESLFPFGRIDAAVLAFCRALEADDRFAPAYNNLGVVAWKRGEAALARRLIEQALECDPGFVPALENREALASHAAPARG